MSRVDTTVPLRNRASWGRVMALAPCCLSKLPIHGVRAGWNVASAGHASLRASQASHATDAAMVHVSGTKHNGRRPCWEMKGPSNRKGKGGACGAACGACALPSPLSLAHASPGTRVQFHCMSRGAALRFSGLHWLGWCECARACDCVSLLVRGQRAAALS